MSKDTIAWNMAQETMYASRTQDAVDVVTFVETVGALAKQLDEAKKAADEALQKVNEAQKRAEQAQEKANATEEVRIIDSKTKALNKTNDNMKNLAGALGEVTVVLPAFSEAQRRTNLASQKQFEIMQQLALATATMIKVSVIDLAKSRSIVRELEARLRGASEEELSELARQEIENVIEDIKSRIDLLERQNKLAEAVQQIEQDNGDRDERIAEQDARLDAMQTADDAQDELIQENSDKNKEQDDRLAEMAIADEEQDELIQQNSDKNKEQDERLAEMVVADEEQDELIQQNSDKNKEQDERLAEMVVADEEQDELIQQNSDKNKEQDERLAEMVVANEEQDELIRENSDKNKEQDEKIDEIININKEQSDAISKQDKEIEALKSEIEHLKTEMETKGNRILLIATSIASAGALIISILQFFI